MRNIIHAAVLCAALPASAQPVTEPRACQVTIARAPEDVRAVVEAWVRSEPQCSVALEVRIVPTEGGLYLLAQDEHGRIRERIVPDAQTAGVLVASWIADDNAPLLPAVPMPRAVAPAPVAMPAGESLAPPGMAPVAIAATAGAAPRSSWLSLGVLVPMSATSSVGLRGELDLLRRGAWSFGVAASIAASETPLYAYPSYGEMTMQDVKLVGYVARTWSWGRWRARPALGLGIVESSGDARLDAYAQYYSLEGTFATFEGSLVVSRELGKQWSAYAGPVASALAQRYEVMLLANDQQPSYPAAMNRAGLDVALFAGVGRRL